MEYQENEHIPRVIESRFRNLQEKRWGTWIRVLCLIIPILIAYMFSENLATSRWLGIFAVVLVISQISLLAVLPDLVAPKLAQKDIALARHEGMFAPIEVKYPPQPPATVWVNERFSYVSSFSPRSVKVLDFKKDSEKEAELSDFRKLFPVIELIEHSTLLTSLQKRRGTEIARNAFCLTVVGEQDRKDSFRTLSTDEIAARIIDNLLKRT